MEIKLPQLKSADLAKKKVIVRADLDVNPGPDNTTSQNLDKEDLFRLKSLIPTIDYLVSQNASIILIGHRGRPEGKVEEDLSLSPVSELFERFLVEEWGEERVKSIEMMMRENLRFEKGEEENDLHFAEHLAELGDFYVNEAFGASHREHASIVSIPNLLPHAAGLRFADEVENLSKVLVNPKKPVVVLIGGVKKDKLDYIKEFEKFADKILIGGRLPEYLEGNEDSVRLRAQKFKTIIGNLIFDKEDLTIHTIEVFEETVAKAGTIVLAGPMGKYEEEGHRLATKRIFDAIVKSPAVKIAGGGDTQKALAFFGMEDKFDWISVGGGACLQFLAKGTLPGIEALKE